MSKEFNKQDNFNKSDDPNFIHEIRSMSQKALDEWENIFQTHAHMDDKLRLNEAVSSIKYMIKSAASSGLCSILLLLPSGAERHNWDLKEWDPPLSPDLEGRDGFPHLLKGVNVPPYTANNYKFTWLTHASRNHLAMGKYSRFRSEKHYSFLIVKELRRQGFTFTRIIDVTNAKSMGKLQYSGIIAQSLRMLDYQEGISLWSISWGEGNGE